ncbi:WEB family protein At5g16730, chloroplastic-like [Zingiber officinale]|uniref:WEB family protein At5g16730, chloroplastic-like n=1 Tax=Zingiber officinale TaxID=94328 RepID=UPI001C4AE85B|nr:WEB family protein At5g16730, chloroplastic-like [Zingiber officinale]
MVNVNDDEVFKMNRVQLGSSRRILLDVAGDLTMEYLPRTSLTWTEIIIFPHFSSTLFLSFLKAFPNLSVPAAEASSQAAILPPGTERKMLPYKSRSGIFEASDYKNLQGSNRITKPTRTGSTKLDSGLTSPKTKQSSPFAKQTSPIPKPRILSDRSPKTVDAKSAIKRNSNTSKPPQANSTNLELHENLNALEKELKKAKEQLALAEQEKSKAFEELNDVKKFAYETNEKLQVATDAQKRAEASLEKELCDKLENARKEGAQEMEEKLREEIISLKSQHSLGMSKLHSISQELEGIKLELNGALSAKEIALKQADEEREIAETYRERVELLSKEANWSKALHNRKLDSMNKEASEMIKKLEGEVSTLKLELEQSKAEKDKLAKMEQLVDELQVEVINARKVESDASELVDDWQKRIEKLKVDLDEAHQSEKSASDSLAAMMVHLEESKSLLEDAESEISTLQGKIRSLEIEVEKQREDLEESDRQVDAARQDAVNIGKTVDLLKLEIQNLEEEKRQAVNRERSHITKAESLMEEHNKLMDELRISRDQEEKNQKAMEGLAVTLQSVSKDAREKDERLLRTQAELEESQAEIEQLNIALRNTEDRYEVMLDEARYEIVCLKNIIERVETEASNLKSEWDKKELVFVNTIRKLEEVASMKVEMTKMVELEKVEKKETKQANADSSCEAEEELKHGSFRLKEIFSNREDEFQEHHKEDYKAKEESTNINKNHEEDHEETIDSDLSSESEHEDYSIDEDLESDVDISMDDGITSPDKQPLNQRKKSALLHKFGSLLKKGNH